jgi:hypothetical protein
VMTGGGISNSRLGPQHTSAIIITTREGMETLYKPIIADHGP